MRDRVSIAVMGVLIGCLVASSAWAEVIAYPKKGQSQQQFEQDQFQCHQWAKGQTGVDPTKPQQGAAAPPPQQGGAVRGAARGAAGGALIGAAAGDAGKGAAIGAAAGAVGGRMRQNSQNRQAADAQQQAQAQAGAGQAQYDKAYGACLEGRGYSVR
ncbi:MAG TPA: glycine zipper family protein [Candidatus Methylomirabilis sp.]|nr:glycine zipper family protein [Candidatus Methylomirabilis sp.]HSC69945.1 glycine zipper family protein [Candidatus Methylomirabilis sp.]